VEEPPTIPASVRQAIAAEFKKPGGLALVFVGIALALVTIFVLPEWKVPAAWPVTLLILMVAYLSISASAIRGVIAVNTTLAKAAHLPRVIRAMQNPGDGDELILLLQPNRLFGQFMLVSIYFEDERGFELSVGSGEVTNVQSDGAIQITVQMWEEPYQNVRRALVEQNADTLGRLLVRPAPTALPGSALVNALLSRNETLRRPGNG